jgi:demethylmenaquinone methyltransferase/2-methoxy-6-polyprenyl-1,4-benzoquinol methylase
MNTLSIMKDKTVDEKKYYSLNKRVWDILAPCYDVIVLPFSRIRERVVELTNANKSSRILDVATGTGKQAFAFARRGYDVVGVDLSEAMLKVAAQKNKYANAKFSHADATSLPFEDGNFDISSISFALHEMPLTIGEKVLAEMSRVTKPGGTVVVVDYGLPTNKIGRFLVYHFVRLYEGKNYSKFMKSDLRTLLGKRGVETIAEVPLLLGAARMVKATRVSVLLRDETP